MEEDKRFFAFYMDSDEQGNPTAKKTPNMTEEDANDFLSSLGGFGRVYDSYKVGGEKKKQDALRDEIKKEFEKPYTDYVSGQNGSDYPKSTDAKEVGEATERSGERITMDIEKERKTSGGSNNAPETPINDQSTANEKQVVDSEDNPADAEVPNTQATKRFSLGEYVVVVFWVNENKANKSKEPRVISVRKEFTKLIQTEYEEKRILVFPGNYSKEEIKKMANSDGAPHVYESIEFVSKALGMPNLSSNNPGTRGAYNDTRKPGQGNSVPLTGIIEIQKKLDDLSTKIAHLESSVSRSSEESKRTINKNARDFLTSEEKWRERLARINEQMQDMPSKRKLDSVVDNVAETIEPISADVREAKSSLEMLQGKITGIEEILSKKGVSIQRENAPSNKDAVVIANAKRVMLRLIDDITEAALAYADNRGIIESLDEIEEKRNKEFNDRIEAVRREAKAEAFAEMLVGYADMTSFFSQSDNEIAITVLKKYGVVPDELFVKDAEIDLTENEIERYLSKASGLDTAGRYRVVVSAYMANKSVIQQAKCIKIEDVKK